MLPGVFLVDLCAISDYKRRVGIDSLLRRIGFTIAILLVSIYAAVALRGPQGIPSMLEKRRSIRQLQQQIADMEYQNKLKQERLDRLRQSNSSELDMEIRKGTKQLLPGETEFILPEQPKPAAPAQ